MSDRTVQWLAVVVLVAAFAIAVLWQTPAAKIIASIVGLIGAYATYRGNRV